jgi:hypothetical protein
MLEMFTYLPNNTVQVSSQRPSTSRANLRFPTGAVLGRHLVVTGTKYNCVRQSLATWALDLHTHEWGALDLGSGLLVGDWHTPALWTAKNKLLIFGQRDSPVDVAAPRARRALGWTHAIMADLESAGIYQPPPRVLAPRTQEAALSALAESAGADFSIVCDDGRELRCARRLLEERWPWFRAQRVLLLAQALAPLEDAPLPDSAVQADRRLELRRLNMGLPYAVTLALLQYVYAMALLTPLQLAPPVLSVLLVFSKNHQLPHLHELVKHAMHVALSKETAWGVYEVARECGCLGLERRSVAIKPNSLFHSDTMLT